MKTIYFIVLGIFASFFFSLKISACSCEPLPPIYRSYETTDAVFIGTVVGSNEPKDKEKHVNDDIFFDVEVIENFKGVRGKQVKLNRGSMSSSCYSSYVVGETYLFYASKKAHSGFFEDKIKNDDIVYQGSFCNRTENIRAAQDQIFFIREMLKGKPEPQIYGSIARSDSDPVSFTWRHTYLENVKVTIENEKDKFETVTDKNGFFRFNNIPEGEYVIKPMPDENYLVYFPVEEKITILPDKKVGSEIYPGYYEPYNGFYGKFTLGWNNRIEGRVVDSEGKPFERYAAKLLPLSKANDEIETRVKGSPDHHGEKGLFWFYAETPDKYVLAIDIYAPFKNSTKKRFFYPQAETIKDAKIFDLKATDKIKDIEVKLPFILRYIKGEVFWSNGVFINDGGWIEIKKIETDNDKINTRFDWENAEKGKFTIQVLEGFEYWVHSEINVDVMENGNKKRLEIKSKPQKIKVKNSDYPLKVTFEKPQNLIEN